MSWLAIIKQEVDPYCSYLASEYLNLDFDSKQNAVSQNLAQNQINRKAVASKPFLYLCPCACFNKLFP